MSVLPRAVPAGPPLLRLAGLRKSFGPVRALRDVSIDFHAGEVLGLLGENGAGKSTLLRTLSGDHVPDAGEISVDGSAVQLRSPRDAHRHQIHVVYQEPELAADLTVAENLFLGDLPRRRHLVAPRAVEAQARALIEREGFTGTLRADARVRDCSPAQRQCVEILKAVRSGVRLLCLDEPTSSLSSSETDSLWALLERLKVGGTSIVYVSHRMAEVQQLCDRVVVMRDGEVVGDHPRADLTQADMIRLMVGRPLSQFFPEHRTPGTRVIAAMHQVCTRSVRDVSLQIREGEVVGLGGLVGAGRSEVARALCGVDQVTAGTISVGGRPVRLRSPKDAIAHGICLAPEDRKQEGLFASRSVSDNISFPLLRRLSRAHVVDRRAESRMVTSMSRQLRVKSHSPAYLVSTLSGGNQQKVVLARWMAMKPALLVLDEPTRGIDVGAKAEIYSIIDDLARSGVGILLISSELPELLGVADRIVVMRAGTVVGEVDAASASEEGLLTMSLEGGDHHVEGEHHDR